VKRKPNRPIRRDRIAPLLVSAIIALAILLALMLVRRYYPVL
jgi:hypothetical protein